MQPVSLVMKLEKLLMWCFERRIWNMSHVKVKLQDGGWLLVSLVPSVIHDRAEKWRSRLYSLWFLARLSSFCLCSWPKESNSPRCLLILVMITDGNLMVNAFYLQESIWFPKKKEPWSVCIGVEIILVVKT